MAEIVSGVAEPASPEEWQALVDLCECLLSMEKLRGLGLVEGGPGINTEKLGQIVRVCHERGYVATQEGVARCLMQMQREGIA